ncbi:MAG: TraX family protein [Rickettsiaceae bacterium]|nr:TraX family protein [Rickettsiaceae bacterium]
MFTSKYKNYSGNIDANWQDFLKFFAIISMITDHLGYYFLPEQKILRVIGRYASVIFCFFVGYNYKRPELGMYFCLDSTRYIKILVLGAIVHLMQIICENIYGTANILVSIVFNLLLVDIVKNFQINSYLAAIFFATLSFYFCGIVDYNTFPAALIILGMNRRFDQNKLEYSLCLYFTLISLMICESKVLDFTLDESFIVCLIFAFIIFCIKYLDFNTALTAAPYKIFLISRYSLAIYVLHIISMMTIYYTNLH